jgi:hypothetical protein
VKNKFIVVFCHSRATELDKCLTSLRNARGFSSWKLIVVQQYGNLKVDRILSKYRSITDTAIKVKPRYNSVLGNINNNRILGMSIAFKEFNADCILGIEEDNQISADALEFIDFISKTYKNKKNFRGINLGSVEYGKHLSSSGYSLLRSGIHGSAGFLTRKTWLALEKKGLLDFDFNDPRKPWDAMIEFYLKTGFMVTPNLSRNLDVGYGGAFAPKNPTHPYFVSIRKSWIQSNKGGNLTYRHIQIPHNFKEDFVAYKGIFNLLYVARTNKILTGIIKMLGIKSIISKLLIKYTK